MNVSDRDIQSYLKSQLQSSLGTDLTSPGIPPGTEDSSWSGSSQFTEDLETIWLAPAVVRWRRRNRWNKLRRSSGVGQRLRPGDAWCLFSCVTYSFSLATKQIFPLPSAFLPLSSSLPYPFLFPPFFPSSKHVLHYFIYPDTMLSRSQDILGMWVQILSWGHIQWAGSPRACKIKGTVSGEHVA